MKVFKVICALFIFGFVSVSHAAVIFITEENADGNGTSLLGADNVEVNGLYYNVRFVDGTCILLFNGCNDSNDLLFNTLDSAIAASDSLLSQVFNGDTLFDSSPELTNGCSFAGYCQIHTVFAVGIFGNANYFGYGAARNLDGTRIDGIRTGSNFISKDFTDETYNVYAVWSEPVEASAPGTAMVLLMGIAGLIVSQRRKQA
jgi:hypothetical protein